MPFAVYMIYDLSISMVGNLLHEPLIAIKKRNIIPFAVFVLNLCCFVLYHVGSGAMFYSFVSLLKTYAHSYCRLLREAHSYC